MTSDLGLVSDTPQRNSLEWPTKRLGEGLGDRSLYQVPDQSNANRGYSGDILSQHREDRVAVKSSLMNNVDEGIYRRTYQKYWTLVNQTLRPLWILLFRVLRGPNRHRLIQGV